MSSAVVRLRSVLVAGRSSSSSDRFAFTVSLAAALLAGCGGGGGGGADGVTATPAASTVAAGAPAATVSGGAAAPVATTSTVVPVGTSTTTIAVEGQSFTVAGTQAVRYGAGDSWITKDVSGIVACTNSTFGSDPAIGILKTCQALTASATGATGATGASAASTATTTIVAPAATAASLLPAVDLARIPVPAVGYSTMRVRAANLAEPGQNPAPTDTGAFREYCEYSHMSYDDPIVYPGSVGGHLHVFFGNTGTDRNSTAASISGSGNSTCAGGTANRTAYWMPAVIDTKDGSPVKPGGSLFYYKAGYHYVDGATIKPFPAGLRMIGGNPSSRAIQDGGVAGFTCYKPDGTWTTHLNIPADCGLGSTLTISIAFPQCWDGVNLDSPDHRSHMAYAGIGCPSTHPVALTEVTMRANFPVTTADGTKNWRLSSDNYDRSLPGGYSSHADWFDGWNSDVMTTWVTRCINATLDCHAYLIGDGRILY